MPKPHAFQIATCLLALVAASCLPVAAAADDEQKKWPLLTHLGPETCGPLVEAVRHGPFDYRRPPPNAIIANVERNHFNQRLAAMRQGKDEYSPSSQVGNTGDNGGLVGGGFGYTLHSFPNHIRALQAIDEYSRKNGFSERLKGADWPVECYFERAIRFVPDDVMVRFLYADYLEARNRHEEADRQIAFTLEEATTKPSLAYNVGLFLARRGKFDQSLELARVAYGAGYSFPGLRKILLRKGKWDPAIDVKGADKVSPAMPQPRRSDVRPNNKRSGAPE